MKKKKNIANGIFIGVVFALLLVYALSMVGILGWGFITSLKSQDDFRLEGNVIGFPSLEYSADQIFKLKNYKLIFDNFEIDAKEEFYVGTQLVTHQSKTNLFGLVVNSVLYALVGALIQAFVPAIVAFVCVKYKYRFSKVVYAVALFAYIVPIVGNFPSVITVLRDFGIYDSFIGMYIQKFSFTGMYFFIYWAYFETFSDTYLEAAQIDGASQANVLFRIVLPLSGKIISSVALILFVQMWNDYQTPLLYLPTHPTVAYGVYYMTQLKRMATLTSTPVKVAGCMLLAIPLLILFIFLKDKLMGNISMGGIKE